MATTPKQERDLTAIADGLGHQLRRKLLAKIAEAPRTGKQSGTSPNELTSKALKKVKGDKLTNVSYHVRILKDKGLIKQVRAEQRRGALEHFYVVTERGLAAIDVAEYGLQRLRPDQKEA